MIRETGEYPQTDERKLLSDVDQLVADGATPRNPPVSSIQGDQQHLQPGALRDAARQEQESADDILDAIDRYMDAGKSLKSIWLTTSQRNGFLAFGS